MGLAMAADGITASTGVRADPYNRPSGGADAAAEAILNPHDDTYVPRAGLPVVTAEPVPPAAEPVAPPTTEPAAEAPPETAARPRRGPTPVNIRNFSVRCGRCNQYMTIVAFSHLDEDWNLYTYECDAEPCNADPSLTRTFIEVPVDLDEFANRDPNWRGGKKWGGA
jgi:hypothetical protein